MNRNRKRKNKMVTGLAVGMAAVLGTSPAVYAADTEKQTVSKEETVYVNADAAGNKKEVIVSNWLKNPDSQKSLKDETDLKDIKNVKGDETYSEKGSSLTWNTEGRDIYYQGKTSQELPVSVHLTYYLDGRKMEPEELAGKSGHLQIRIHYKNNAKKTVAIDGKEESLYSPFVLLTGLILPEEIFSNVVIDNGKVISDGNRNIVLGIAMPGMKESLGLKEEASEINLPEELEVSADVTDFAMDPTFTIALTDVMEELNTDDIADYDKLKDSLNDLEDAALKLVDGSKELSDGTNTLGEKYEEFDQGVQTLKTGIGALNSGALELASGIGSYTAGADELNEGIQTYLGKSGVLTGKVKEYVNGVNTVVGGVKEYTKGADELSDGISLYIAGEEQIASGAKGLSALSVGLPQIRGAIEQLHGAVDGKGSQETDILCATQALAQGTKQLESALEQTDLQQLMGMVDAMTKTGNELISQAGAMSGAMQSEIIEPVSSLIQTGNELAKQLQALNAYTSSLKQQAQTALNEAEQVMVEQINAQIAEKNNQLKADAQSAAAQAADQANQQLANARASLDSQIASARAGGNEELAAALEGAKANIPGGVSVSPADVGNLDGVAVPDVSVNLEGFDASAITSVITGVESSIAGLQNHVNSMMPAINDMKTKLDSISAASGKIPSEPMAELKKSVAAINQGMQKLNGAVTTLSQSTAQLDQSTVSLPEAGKGIEDLLGGLETLSANNKELLKGAAQLKSSSPILVQGVGTLQGGTSQLTSGLNDLSVQLSLGASSLSSNSQALRAGASTLTSGTNDLLSGSHTLQDGSTQVKSGISELKDGAKTLKDGMKEFDEEGTGKLKETVEDEVGTLLDRLKALSSDDFTYDTFSGKADSMDGNVKFIIETEAIGDEES